MATFDLLLNPVSSINESGNASLGGTVVGVTNGGEVTLDINWGDPLSSPQLQQLILKDNGTNGDSVAGDGTIQFSLSKQYLDDNPTATPFDSYSISVKATENFLIGTDAVFVIDRSASTFDFAQGLTTPVGDQNGDGVFNTVLDVEIASFIALNQSLIDRGLGNVAKVSIVQFSTLAQRLDLNPFAAGFQSFTTPSADTDGNGVLDVVQALRSIQGGGGTNYEAGLQQAIAAIGAAGTAFGDGNVIFLSDGVPNLPNSNPATYADEVSQIRNGLGQNLRAFGVGTGAVLGPLRAVDPSAQVFTNPQDLLNVFGGAGAGTNTDTATTSVRVNDVAPKLGILTSNPLSIIVQGDSLTLSAAFTDVGTLDTHTGSINWGDSTISNLGTVVGTAGGSHVYSAPGNYTATLTVTDDDTLSDSAAVNVTVAQKVVIDWKPGSNPSAMNFTGGGTVPVAILGSSTFNVAGVNISSIRTDDEKDKLLSGGGVGVNQRNNGTYQSSYEDTNSDGFTDLVLHFSKQSLGSVVKINENPFKTDGQIYLFGQVNGGGSFFGVQQVGDPIKIV